MIKIGGHLRSPSQNQTKERFGEYRVKNRNIHQNYKHNLYLDFVEEYPDYGPKAKMTISRTKFYKWLVAYAIFKEGVAPEEGRDAHGRWMRIKQKQEIVEQVDLDF